MSNNGWRTVRIDELGQIITGNTPPKKNPAYFGSDYKWIKPTDIEIGKRFVPQPEEGYSELAYQKYKNALLPKDSICIVTIGTVGEKMCMTAEPSFTNQSINAIVPNKELFVPMYLYYLIKYNLVQVLHRNPGTSSGRHHVSKSNFSSIEVGIIESKNTQQKIASVLSSYDDLIDTNIDRINSLEESAKRLYQEWFVKFRFPGHENVSMVDSELGPIPEGWKVGNLSDFCSKVIDGTHDSPKSTDSGFHLITGKHLVNGFIDFSDSYLISAEEHRKVMARSKPEKGDIIFSNIGTLGSIALVDQDFEFSIKNVALFKPQVPELSSFLFVYFSSSENLYGMQQRASGTSQRFFSLKFLRELPMIIPPNKLVIAFDDLMSYQLVKRSFLNSKNQQLCAARDLLLPKLISGQLDVSELDIATEEMVTA